MILNENIESTLIGDGVAVTLNTNTKAYAAEQIKVYKGTATTLGTLLTLDVDYTLSGLSLFDAAGLATDDDVVVTLTTPPAVGAYVRTIRDTEAKQTVSISTSRAFDPSALEGALDRLVMMMQERRDAQDSSVRITGGALDPLIASPNTVIGFDANGLLSLLGGAITQPVASWLVPILVAADEEAFRDGIEMIVTVTDWNQAHAEGSAFVRGTSSSTNKPVAGEGFSGIYVGSDANNGVLVGYTEVSVLQYVRRRTAGVWGTWANPNAAIGFNDLIINGDFSLWQRGISPAASVPFGPDRWRNLQGGTLSTATITRQTHPLNTTIGSSKPLYFARHTVPSNSGNSTYARMEQRIESVAYAGSPITVLFWAKLASGTGNIYVDAVRNYGTGGSPSAEELYAGTTFALTTSWVAYKVYFPSVSLAGKTLGSNGDDYFGIRFWAAAGSDFNAITGGLGNQTITVDYFGVHTGFGDTPVEGAASFRNRPIWQTRERAERYTQRIRCGGGPGGTSQTIAVPVNFRTQMRGTPTVESQTDVVTVGAVTLAFSDLDAYGAIVQATSAGSTGRKVQDVIFSAEL